MRTSNPHALCALCTAGALAGALGLPRPFLAGAQRGQPKSVFSDFRNEHPGVVHKITLADLPAPMATRAVDNSPTIVPRPAGAMPDTRWLRSSR